MRPEPSELQELVRELHQQATPWLPAGLSSRLSWGVASIVRKSFFTFGLAGSVKTTNSSSSPSWCPQQSASGNPSFLIGR